MEIAVRGAVGGVGRRCEDRWRPVMQNVTAISGSNSTMDLRFCQVLEG
jgi:hypothetical protein